MNCELCKKNILNYNADFNCLQLEENKSVNICSDCINKFLKWQQNIFAKLYPTKAIKKRYNK